MELIKYKDLTFEQLTQFRNYNNINESIIKFENYSTPTTFKKIFNEDGTRLWEHWVYNCDRTWKKFLTYLTNEQRNDVVINVHLNYTIYI